MKVTILFLLSTMMAQLLNSQDLVTVNFYKVDGGYVVYADNQEYTKVSIELDMVLTNMKSSNGNHKIFIVPAEVQGYEITRLEIVDPTKHSNFNINTICSLGDYYQTEYDYDFPYHLPFEVGRTYKIIQGYNGSYSHKNQYSLDFDIPEGGNILAARDGIVVDMEDRNSKSCGHRSCNKFNNYIRIYHSDGTFAEYTHIQQNSATVRIGDKVKQDQVIAACGDVGWTTGAHLHFEVFLLYQGKKKTVPTQFKISENDAIQELESKKSYRKDDQE